MITETDEVRDALDRAARVWPDLRGDRAALLRRLLEYGTRHVVSLDDERRTSRLTVIRETSGSMPGVWPDDAVARMRDEWPE
jgi:hypothetical protein